MKKFLLGALVFVAMSSFAKAEGPHHPGHHRPVHHHPVHHHHSVHHHPVHH